MGFLRKLFAPSDETTASNREPIPTTVAACILLLEIATSDNEFDASEQERIRLILQTKYDVPEEDIDAVLKQSRDTMHNAIDLWHFTNRINETCDPETRKKIMEDLWDVVYADGKLSHHEDYLIHKIAKLLRLSHRDLIEAKLAVKRRYHPETS